MAPELALEALDGAKRDAVVLDPMCGSGTVLKHAIAGGRTAVGFDLDPMAILLSRVSCRRLRAETVVAAAERLVREAENGSVALPWIDGDTETADFVDFWFAEPQRIALRRLAAGLAKRHGPTADVLRVALSRIIITKDRGASLARDVSHSRPHRVRVENDYDVFDGFLRAAKHVSALVDSAQPGRASVELRDARYMPKRLTGEVDVVVTSPPYLNAIDYMRAHRMSLVWLGHQLSELRGIRSTSVGAERQADKGTVALLTGQYPDLPDRHRRMLERYAHDVALLCRGIHRVLKPTGEALLVVGDCTLGGVTVHNSAIVRDQAERAGLKTVEERSRPLPAGSRYLPPPAASTGPLSKRLRHEVVLRFRRSSVASSS